MADDKPADKVKNKLSGLEGALGKHSEKLPKLNEGTRNTLGTVLPWGAGVFAVIMFFWAKDLMDGARAVGALDFGDSIFGGALSNLAPSSGELWTVTIMFAAVVLLIAGALYKGVLKQTKAGWDFLFYAMLVSVVAGVTWLLLLGEYASGRGWITGLVGLGGLYLLFQAKSSFNK